MLNTEWQEKYEQIMRTIEDWIERRDKSIEMWSSLSNDMDILGLADKMALERVLHKMKEVAES